MLSALREANPVVFPPFTEERIYMVPIKKGEPLPEAFKRWQTTIDLMLETVDTDETIYMTCDQKMIRPGGTHRQPGIHIDGNWDGAWPRPPQWKTHENLEGGGLILAADHFGCKAYIGEVSGQIGNNGDARALDLSKTEEIITRPNRAYVGNVTMVHDALPALDYTDRTLVRLTLPASYKEDPCSEERN